MVSGLNQFPAFLPLLMKEILQPFDAAWIGIMHKTKAILITFNGSGLFFRRAFRKFMDRDLIFPLDPRFFSKLEFQMSKSLPTPGLRQAGKCQMNAK